MAPADAPCLDDPRCAASSGDERVAEPGKAALVLLALAMGGFAIGVTEFAAMSVLPDFAAGLGVSEPTAGHVISAYAAGVVVGAPILASAAFRTVPISAWRLWWRRRWCRCGSGRGPSRPFCWA